ncbi:MAG: dipeptidase, partial [Sphingomonadales bacterium]|nr:dipeptidase [Sphingomonadales bacterium]
LGVLVDLSHSNTPTTLEAAGISTKPVAATHTGARSVHGNIRNKSDAELRAIAETGGVVGVYLMPFLAPSPRQPDTADFIAHVRHVLAVCGEDHTGIGTDQWFLPTDTSDEAVAAYQEIAASRQAAGINAPEEDRLLYVEGLNTPDRHNRMAEAMAENGLPAATVDKIMGLNFMRVFEDAWI